MSELRPCRSVEEWSESHDTLWWLHRSNGTTSCRFRLNMLSAWLRQTQWQYKWQVWYSHASLILHYAIFASCNGGLSSEKLGFIFHCCHYFESDFEIDGAKLMRFSDIFARMTVSLILFVYHTCEYDFQWNQVKRKWQIIVFKYDFSFKYDCFSEK